MALLPMGPSLEQSHASQQESMFADPFDFPEADRSEELGLFGTSDESEFGQSELDEREQVATSRNGDLEEGEEDLEEEATTTFGAPSYPALSPVLIPSLVPSATHFGPGPVAVPTPVSERNAEPQPAPQLVPSAESASAPLTVDDFTELEERVLRAVHLVRREREAVSAAETRAADLQAQLDAQAPVLERLHQEIATLRTEREQVRHRVERLLSQLDALEL